MSRFCYFVYRLGGFKWRCKRFVVFFGRRVGLGVFGFRGLGRGLFVDDVCFF